MFCPKCGSSVKDVAKFCGNCGFAFPETNIQAVPVGKQCASCGSVLKDEAKFCPGCGKPVPAVETAVQSNPAVSEPVAVVKNTIIDKAVYHCLGRQYSVIYFYKNENVVGMIIDTNGDIIPSAKEWLETKYENLIVENIK